MLNSLNLEDDNPTFLFGLCAEDCADEDIPPLYISVNSHNSIIHNAMYGSGDSHNMMPRIIMEELGLEVTRPYRDIFSFDSNKVRCLRLIKYLVVSLAQIPAKNLVMDVVVADIPPNFGMLLSRSWETKLKGTFQMDMSYATILVFGTQRRIFMEQRLSYMVTSAERPNNHPIYALDTELGSSIFFTEVDTDIGGSYNASFEPTQEELDGVLKVIFDVSP